MIASRAKPGGFNTICECGRIVFAIFPLLLFKTSLAFAEWEVLFSVNSLPEHSKPSGIAYNDGGQTPWLIIDCKWFDLFSKGLTMETKTIEGMKREDLNPEAHCVGKWTDCAHLGQIVSF